MCIQAVKMLICVHTGLILSFVFISHVQIPDNSDLWGGYLLSCFILDDSRIPLTVASMLK